MRTPLPSRTLTYHASIATDHSYFTVDVAPDTSYEPKIGMKISHKMDDRAYIFVRKVHLVRGYRKMKALQDINRMNEHEGQGLWNKAPNVLDEMKIHECQIIRVEDDLMSEKKIWQIAH